MEIIDRGAWPREGHYRFFAPMSQPFYSLTFPVDVTALRACVKERRLPFYPAMVYQVTRAMDDVEAFRLRDRNGTIVRHDQLVPSFTDLKPGSELFHIVTLPAGEDMADFCARAKEASAQQTEFITAGDWDADQEVYFTCLPWFPITGLTNERNADPSDTIPRVSWGRWEERDGRTTLSLSLELNHRLLDGFHVGRLYAALNARLAELSNEL